MKPLLFLSLMLFSILSFGAKIIVTGEPIVLEHRGDLYYPPANFTEPVPTSYTYVTVDGVTRVCYLNPQPAFANLDMITINVEVKGTTSVWNCYAYNTTYFEAQP
ncbi:hypothetical protein GCM10007966_22630 [Legionella impletisoli]|uniref:Uncharacterized protein n=2 Tax=Legionella impletisoli TaxID=343510 RepID=A0A917JYX9_9GAMM|nr:hypothetical protein GCM10007966_22630 [Legionella impletisoli]